jgi:hypothetical protein
MQQIHSTLYLVEENEHVTITATLLNGVISEALQVFRNGELPNLGGESPRYEFDIVTASGGTEIVTMFCSFAGLDDTAEVDTQVQGAPSPGPTLKIGQNQQNLNFNVVASINDAKKEARKNLTATSSNKGKKAGASKKPKRKPKSEE